MLYNTICNNNGTDKGDQLPNGNGYANFYEFWFQPIKQTCEDILEIGVDEGNSLRTNCEYFTNAKIIGLDISDKKHCETERIKTEILDQSSIKELENFCQNIQKQFDIIIDDGSHDVSHQQMTFGKFFRILKPDGLYIIEDLGSSYFTFGENLYGYIQTQDKIINNTIHFLNQRPFFSPWISSQDLEYINENVDYISIFDKTNHNLIYSNDFNCINKFPIRSITSIIKKKGF